MALIVEAVGQSGVVERITVEGGKAFINAQPGLNYRILDESGRQLNTSATIRRVADHLIIEGLPGETTVQLTDFFFVCTPNDPCSLDLEGIGGANGETITQMSEPIAAMADGSFVLHAPASMATPTAPEAEFSAKPALAGLALLAVAGGGGGGGGGGSDGPPPPPPGSTTVTSPPATNDPTPVITGTAAAGARITVTLEIPGSSPVTYNTIADGNGNWAVDTGSATPTSGAMPAAGLPLDAPTTVRVLTGGTGETISYQLEMDLDPPAAPVIDPVTGDDIISADEARDADPSPIVVEGSAEAGATVRVSWHGEDQVTTADADGRWSVTFDGQEIPDGDDVISAVATDLAGNSSSPGTRPVSVVTDRPSRPIVDEVTGDNIINIAESNSGITITGTATAGNQVFVSFAGLFTDREADVSGETWSVTVDSTELAQLADGGSYAVTAYASDGINRSAVGTSEEIRVDRTAPSAPSIGAVADDNVINAAEAGEAVVITGAGGEPGGTVQVRWGGTTLDPVNVNEDGTWTAVFESGQVPGDGPSTIIATAFDAAGNPSAAAGERPVTVDTTVAAPTFALANDTGSGNSDGITNDGTINVSGLESGATWEYSVDNGANWSPGSGTSFELSPSATPYAAGTVQVRQTDLAGNQSAAGSNAGDITVDATAPSAPTIALTEDTGTPGDGITSNGSVTVSGLEAGAAWEYSIDGGSNWATGSGTSFNLTAGNYAAGTILARQIDLAGNPSGPASIGIDIQVDANPPPAPPPPTLANDTGPSGSDGITNVGTMNVSGIVGASWQYSTDGGSNWSAAQAPTTTTFTLGPGTYAEDAVQVRQTNAAGLTGNPGIHAGAITVDTEVFPLQITDNFPGVGEIADGDIVFTFDFQEAVFGFDLDDIEITGIPSDSVASFSGANGSDSYTLTVPVGVDQAGEVSVSVAGGVSAATDAAGNGVSGGSASQTYDTMRTITIESLFDNDNADGVTGSHTTSPAAANDATPTLTIALSDPLALGESVHVHRNGANLGLVMPAGGSVYEFTDTTLPPGTSGTYTYTAHVYSGSAPTTILSSDFVYQYTPFASP